MSIRKSLAIPGGWYTLYDVQLYTVHRTPKAVFITIIN